MSLYSTFKTDQSLEKDGIVIEYGTDDEENPIRFRVARAGGGNKKFAKQLQIALKPHRRAMQTETMSDALADKIYREVFCKTVLLGWENVTDESGKILDFTFENAMKILSDLPDLFEDLKAQASKVSLFRQEVLDSDLGNSGTSLNTDSSKGQQKPKS